MPHRHALGFSANYLYFPTFDDGVLFPLSCQALVFQTRLMTRHSTAYCKPPVILNWMWPLPKKNNTAKMVVGQVKKGVRSPANFVKMDVLITLTF